MNENERPETPEEQPTDATPPEEAPAPAAERRPSRAGPPDSVGEPADEVVPGADLEPDLVLDDQPQEEDRYAEAAERYPAAEEDQACLLYTSPSPRDRS